MHPRIADLIGALHREPEPHVLFVHHRDLSSRIGGLQAISRIVGSATVGRVVPTGGIVIEFEIIPIVRRLLAGGGRLRERAFTDGRKPQKNRRIESYSQHGTVLNETVGFERHTC